ncbi:MAG: cytochrome c peroxidase [Planctomycetota bacterium]|nr:cytochrome c peroxidase [Planctomycetota bacterium]
MTMGNSRGRRIQRAVMVLILLAPALIIALAPSADAGKEDEGRQPFKVNAKTAKKIELGRRLFYDKMVSQTSAQACVDCHDPNHGFSDKRRFSQDERGLSPRHSQPILNTASNPSTHWDGEFENVEEAVKARIGRPLVQQYYGVDMPVAPTTPTRPRRARPTTRPPTSGQGPIAGGSPTVPVPPPVPARGFRGRGNTGSSPIDESVAVRIEDSKRYAEAFRAVYGTSNVTVAKIADAMAAYCHSIESTDSKYDKFKQGDETALTASAKRGLELFKGRAGCAQCHSLNGDHALLTDYAFHNTGIAWLRTNVDKAANDFGRKRFTSDASDERAFKTPTLRDAKRRPPYMHDGRFKTLEEVVRYYAKGGSTDPLQDERIKGFEASDEDVKDLVAFIESLTSIERPGYAKTAWDARPAKQRLRFVSPSGRILKGLRVAMIPHGDGFFIDGQVASNDPIRLTVEKRSGWVEFAPPMWTHSKIEIEDGLVEAAIPLVPDTLKKAKITVPVEGKMKLTITAKRESFTPETLLAGTSYAINSRQAIRGDGTPITVTGGQQMHFRRTGLVRLGDKVVARYEGWVPTNLLDNRIYVQIDGYSPNSASKLAIDTDVGDEAAARIDLTK